MAAKKVAAKKMASMKKPDPKKKTGTVAGSAVGKKMTSSKSKYNTGGGFNQLLPKADKKSQAGDLASERGTMRQAAQRNRGFRKSAEETGLSFGLINVTYRDQGGKLKNSVMNRKRGSTFPSQDVLFMGDVSKKQPKKKK
jgi:hypothetical protein